MKYYNDFGNDFWNLISHVSSFLIVREYMKIYFKIGNEIFQNPKCDWPLAWFQIVEKTTFSFWNVLIIIRNPQLIS